MTRPTGRPQRRPGAPPTPTRGPLPGPAPAPGYVAPSGQTVAAPLRAPSVAIPMPPRPRPPEPPVSPIAREREDLKTASLLFWAATLLLGATVGAILLWLALRDPAAQTAEAAFLASNTPLGQLETAFGLSTSRIIAAVLGGATTAATAWVGRRLFHAEGVGLVAGVLVGLDPAFLADGHLALPTAIAQGCAMLALAFLLASRPVLHWFAMPLLAIVALAVPGAIPWLLALGVLALLRGHIYAAPKHLAIASAQVLVVPALAVLLVGTMGGAWPGLTDCLAPGFLSSVALLKAPYLGPVTSVHSPVVWFGGLGSLLLLGGAAVGLVLARFRIARLPGRLQMRLEDPLSPGYARILWLCALTLFAPPLLWLPLVCLALVAGIQQLSAEARGFGFAVTGAVLAFAAFGLVRAWGAVTGSDAVTAYDLVPWVQLQGCTIPPAA